MNNINDVDDFAISLAKIRNAILESVAPDLIGIYSSMDKGGNFMDCVETRANNSNSI